MRYLASPAQRTAIHGLLRRAELDPHWITLMNKQPFERAGLRVEGWLGRRVNEFVDQLTQGQASQLIEALQAQVEDA